MKNKIVVVDDIYANRFLLEQCLSEYIVHSLPDGQSLFTYLENDIPDLIILDVGLPDEDGFSIARKLERNSKYMDIPVIFVTAHSSREDVLQGFKAGGYDYIVKPFDSDVLIERVQNALTKKRVEHLRAADVKKDGQ